MPSGDRPNLLYLTHRVPCPPDRGDRIRSYHWLRYLSERANVYLGCLADEPVSDATRGTLSELCRDQAIVPVQPRARWIRAAASVLRGHTATEGLFASAQLRQRVERWASETRFDAVVVFCSSMVSYSDIRELRDTPRIIDLVDVDSQKWFDYAEKSAGPKRWLYHLEGRRLRRLERSLPASSRAITLVSESEAELFRGFAPASNVHAVPNGVDLHYFSSDNPDIGPCAGEAELTAEFGERPIECVFVGVLDYWANVEGLTWFCRDVWPRVRERIPEARFTLVGKRPGAAVQRLAELPGIELVGEVPDVRPYLARADLVLVPLRIARGIQNKVLEALAMSKPVIASPRAIEGLGVEPGTHLLEAGGADQWLAEIERLAGDSEERNRLGRQGREFVERCCSWEARLRPLDGLLRLPAGAGRALGWVEHGVLADR